MSYLGSIIESETEELLEIRISLKNGIERLIFNPHIGERMMEKFMELAEESDIMKDFHIVSGSILIKTSRFFSKIRDLECIECYVGGNHSYITLYHSRKGMRTIISRIPKGDTETIAAYLSLMAKAKKNIEEKTRKWEAAYIKLSLMATPYLVGQEV
jgi:hypothetical protein